MSRAIAEVAGSLAAELGSLAHITWQQDWAPGEPSSKPIPISKWTQALTIALIAAREMPWLEKPVPGADPGGWVWLTWRQGDRAGFALEMRPDKYRWTQNHLGDKKTFESSSLNDVIDGMRATFDRPLVLT